MKTKALMVAIIGIFCCVTALARDNYSYDVNVLPAQAQSALKSYFPKKSVNHIKIDKNMLGVEGYDVVLNDGTEIDFDSKGNIKEVDCGIKGQVPDALVMKSIRDYVKSNYPKQKIVKYDVKRNGYEVELTSGIDLEFNAQGTFVRIDRKGHTLILKRNTLR